MIHRPIDWRRDEDDVPKRLKDNNAILFSDDNLAGVRLPYDDPLVISAVVANYDVQRIIVDNGSSTDVLIYDIFSKCVCLDINYGDPPYRSLASGIIKFMLRNK